MTLFFNFWRYGFFWSVWAVDVATMTRTIFRLRFHRTAGSQVWREWSVMQEPAGGLRYTENTPRRQGSWVLRGPWVKVA